MFEINHFLLFTRIEVEIEVRKNVDELMREELKNLKMVCLRPEWFYFCLLTPNDTRPMGPACVIETINKLRSKYMGEQMVGLAFPVS